jgi:SAM-dependent methyltransferase
VDPALKETVEQIWNHERDRELRLLETASARFSEDARFLEIGCGRLGLLTETDRLQGLRDHSFGIDVDLEALAVNRNVRYRLGANCSDLPFPSHSFDFVACRWVFEHLEDPDCALRELSRVLRFDGCLLITTPNLLNYAMFLSKHTPTNVHNLVRGWSGSHVNTATFYRANTRRRLTHLARNHGLTIRHFEYVPYSFMYFGFHRHVFKIMRGISRTVSKITPRFDLRMVCLMTKTR